MDLLLPRLVAEELLDFIPLGELPLVFLLLLLLLWLGGETGVCGRIGSGGGLEGYPIGLPLYFCILSTCCISSTCCMAAAGPSRSDFFFHRLAMVKGRLKSGRAG